MTVTTRNHVYVVEEKYGKYVIKDTTHERVRPFIIGYECTRPIFGQRLIIMSSDPNNQVITSTIVEIT